MYYLDLLGTLAFAITGAYKAKGAQLNIFGIILLGIVTAVGGGTFRDVIINRTPLFYLHDQNYLIVSILAGILIYFVPNFFKKGYPFFRLIDSIGIAAFTIIGVSTSFTFLFPGAASYSLLSFLVCTFLGMITAVGGGIIRDSVMGGSPVSLQTGSNYILSAFWGSCIYYLMMFDFDYLSVIISFSVTLYLREFISTYGIYQKLYKKEGTLDKIFNRSNNSV